MASDWAERIRAGYESWNRGEAPPRPPVEDFEFSPPPDLPGKRVYRGPGALAEFAADLADSFDSHRVEPLGVEESGDHVIARVRLTASGRHSGIDVEREEFHLWTFGPSGPRRVECFPTRAAALERADGDSTP